MKESKAVFVRKRDFKAELNREYQFYTTKITRNGKYLPEPSRYDQNTQEVGCQYNSKRDNLICTCRYLAPPRRRQEFRYFGSPKQIYSYQGSRSSTDIGVGSVKALQRKKVKRIYLPEKIERGVGSSYFSSYVLQRTRQHRANSYYENKRTSSKCVGGILEYNIGCVINEKLSPIIQTVSGSTSCRQSTLNKTIEIGSSSAVKNITNTTTQVENSSNKDIEIKSEMKVEKIIQPIKITQEDPKETKTIAVDSRKAAKTKYKPAEKVSSSDSLLQHVHNLENPSDERNSHLFIEAADIMENKLELEYRSIFSAKTKSKDSSHASDLKSTSTLKRRFEALRRGLAKRDDSKKNAVIVNKVASQVSARSRKDVSINSDPPSLEGRSYSNTKPYSPFSTSYSRDKNMYNPRASHYKQSVSGNKKERGSAEWSTKAVDDDSETQGVKGMFKLWGKKFNLEEDNYKKRCTPKPSYNTTKKAPIKKTEVPKVRVKSSSKPETDVKKESKRFFFFKTKKKIKEKSYKDKKGVTAGRCEVRDGLVIKILGGDVFDSEGIKNEPECKPDNYEEIVRKAWLKRFLTPTTESRNSVKVRWNNKTYAQSSTVFELMDNIYKDTSVIFRSKSQVTVQSSYKSYTRQHVNFVKQNIEAWMIPKTFTDRPKLFPIKQIKQQLTCKSDEDRKDNMEVRISDQKWFIDKSKAFSHKIEVVLHSDNFKKLNRKQSSEYLRIDIPKGFFVDSSNDEINKRPANRSSDEEVYKVVEYETGSDLKKDKATRTFNIGDHKQNKIKVTVSVKESKNCVSKVLETTVKKPRRRDVVVQGSNVYIPKRCDVIGVGIITHRDLNRLRKPILKIQDDFSDEESEHNLLRLHSKRCEFAESYLQEYYRHWTPLGIDLYSWCVSDSQLKCCSEHFRSSYRNQGYRTKSCPNIFEEYQTSAIVSSCGASSCSQCFIQKDKNEWFKNKKKDKKDEKCDPDKRVLPKDSIEVFKKRKIYALSDKSKWCSPCTDFDQQSIVQSVDSKCGQSSPLHECPKLMKSCCKPMEFKKRKRSCKKHVSLPDCDTMNNNLATQLSNKVPESIMTFKGASVCETCKKKVSCPKHAKVNPVPSCEIPRPPCRDSCEKLKKPPCGASKKSCEKPPSCQSSPPPCSPSESRLTFSCSTPPSNKLPSRPQMPCCRPTPPPPYPPTPPPPCPPTPPPPCPYTPPCRPTPPPPCPPTPPPPCPYKPPCRPTPPPPCPHSPPCRPTPPPPCPPSPPPPCPPASPPCPPPTCVPSPRPSKQKKQPPCPPSPPRSPKRQIYSSTPKKTPPCPPSPPLCPPSPPRCPASPPPCQPSPSRSPPSPPPCPPSPPTFPPSPPTFPPSPPPCPPKSPPSYPPSPKKKQACPPSPPPFRPKIPPSRTPPSPKRKPVCPPTPPSCCISLVRCSSHPSGAHIHILAGSAKPSLLLSCPHTPSCPPKQKKCPHSPCLRPPQPPCYSTRPPCPASPPPCPVILPTCPHSPRCPPPSRPPLTCQPSPCSCGSSSCFPTPTPSNKSTKSPLNFPPCTRPCCSDPNRCPALPAPCKKGSSNLYAKLFKKKPVQNGPASPLGKIKTCMPSIHRSLACQHSMTSISCKALYPDAPFYYSPIHPCSPELEPKKPKLQPKKLNKCSTPPCCNSNDNFPWPTKNQMSNQSSTTSLGQKNEESYGKCRKDCSMMPKMSCETVPSLKKLDCKPSCPNYEGSPRLPCLSQIPAMQCPPPPRCPSLPAEYLKACDRSISTPIPVQSKTKISGLFLKMKPATKKLTCSKECLAWESNEDGCISLNSTEKITIRVKKETPSTEEIREGLNLKVQDEDGLTLFERKDYRLQHADCGIQRRPSLLGEMYKASEVRRVTTNNSAQAIGIDKDKRNEIKEVASDASIANLIEIQFKLKVTQGEKTTEIDIANDGEKDYEENIERKRAKNKISEEVFVVKTEGERPVEHSDQKNDINIRIVIKNFKSKSGKKKSVNLKHEDYNDFSKKISAKFHTVSTGYSDIFHDDNVFSVHRATVDLTSSVDNTKMNNTSIHSNRSVHSHRSVKIMREPAIEIRKAISMGSSEPSVCRCITTEEDKSEDTEVKSFPSQKYSNIKDIQENAEETDTQLTDHKYEYNEDTDTEKPIKYDTEETDTDRQFDPPKYDTETDTEKRPHSKYDTFMSTTDTEEPDTLPEIKKLQSLDVIVKPQNKDERKEMLKHVMEKVNDNKYKNKTRMRKLRDMLKVILTSDSSDHDDTKVQASDLAKNVTYESLKPNYFRDTDSMNNYYKMDSKTVLSEAATNRQVIYPTLEKNSDCSNSVRSVDELSSENEPKGECMCSTVAARLKLASRIGEGGGCCCAAKKIIKKNEETICDLKRESDYHAQIDYKNTEYVDVQTQNSRYLTSKINSTNLSVHSSIRPSIGGSFNFKEEIKADSGVLNVDSRQFCLRKKTFYPEQYHVRDCVMKKRNRSAFLGISDEEKIILLSGHSTRLPTGNNNVNDKKKDMTRTHASDILQSYEAKKAVLEIYTEKTISDDEEHLVAKLPKFVYDREQEIQSNYEAMATNTYKTVCKKNIIMMAIKR